METVLAELKQIKQLLQEKQEKQEKPQEPQAHVAPPAKVSLKHKFWSLMGSNQFDDAFKFLEGLSVEETADWGPLPAGWLIKPGKLVYACLRRGLVDLETAHTETLNGLFDKYDVTPEDRKWLLDRKVSTTTAYRLRVLTRGHAFLTSDTPLIQWLCMKPACVDRLDFAWKLCTSTNESVFPCEQCWNNSYAYCGDSKNPLLIKWWAENVLVTKQLSSAMQGAV